MSISRPNLYISTKHTNSCIFYIPPIFSEAIKHHLYNQATHDKDHYVPIVLLLSQIIGPNKLIFLAETDAIVAKIQFKYLRIGV